VYYAACCCEGPAPVCSCGDFRYASIQWAFGDRRVPNLLYDDKCDAFCQRARFTSWINQINRYSAGKIYMICGFSGGATLYTTEDMPDQFQRFDPSSVVVLETEQNTRFDTETVPSILNCCNPSSLYCFNDPGTYVSIDNKTSSLLPFDVLDLPGGFGPSYNATASTYVIRGDQFGADFPTEFKDRIEPNLYYRRTTVTCSWRLNFRRFSYSFNPFFEPYEESSVDDLLGPIQGSPFSQNVHQIKQVSLIGDECDAHAIGTNVVTYGAPFNLPIGAGNELPGGTSLQDSYPQTCGPWNVTIPCCQPFTFGPTFGQYDSFFITEFDGGLFSLEFFDDPPPELP